VSHKQFIKNSKFISYDSVEGQMYDLGSYPAYIKGEGIVNGEVYEMSNYDFEKIKRMEEGAGYETIEITTNEGRKVLIFSYLNNSIKEHYKLIDTFTRTTL